MNCRMKSVEEKYLLSSLELEFIISDEADGVIEEESGKCI